MVDRGAGRLDQHPLLAGLEPVPRGAPAVADGVAGGPRGASEAAGVGVGGAQDDELAGAGPGDGGPPRQVLNDDRACFVLADLFAWRPDQRYDIVFFGFWLSPVPLERFAEFWALVDDCLAPHGRVLFVDDAYRTPDELIQGEASATIRRRLSDGNTYQIVKVPHVPAELEARVRSLGWDIRVTTTTEGPFFWGAGSRA